MSDVNAAHGAHTAQTLGALSQVKDLRKSLAEAEYLRRLRHQRDMQQDCSTHQQRLEHSKSLLPRQKAAILAELTARPVDLRKIHSAHETIRTLHHRIEILERKRQELEEKYREACSKEASARRNFTEATRQLQKFQEVSTYYDKLARRQLDEQEQGELEDRSPARSHLMMIERK
jgi:chromatin segregation and condensation protein Rec8/ScpA/Scc1 (kleisin family)